MSKREERLRKKLALEAAKKNMPPPPPGEPPIKRKVGRPRKHPLPENAGDKPEKRKYKPRKPKNEDGMEGSDAEKTVKEKRREKPKTPPLELRREDYTEDQLQKPNKNYGVLIDEVLTAAPDGLHAEADLQEDPDEISVLLLHRGHERMGEQRSSQPDWE